MLKPSPNARAGFTSFLCLIPLNPVYPICPENPNYAELQHRGKHPAFIFAEVIPFYLNNSRLVKQRLPALPWLCN